MMKMFTIIMIMVKMTLMMMMMFTIIMIMVKTIKLVIIKEEVNILLVQILVGGFRDLRVTLLFLIHHNEGSPKA